MLNNLSTAADDAGMPNTDTASFERRIVKIFTAALLKQMC